MKRIIKKLTIYSIILFLVGLIVSSYISFNGTNYSYREAIQLKVYSAYKKFFLNNQRHTRSYSQEKVDELKVKEYQILLDQKEIDYFKDLWANYEKGAPSDGSICYSKEGSDYYKKNRKWVPAKIVENGDTFKIKMRTHGIQPDDHHFGDYFSFHLKGSKKVLGKKKLKFIIGEIMSTKPEILSYYSKKFNLIWSKPNKQVKARINNLPYKLFYLEDKFEDPLNRPIEKTDYTYYKSGIQALELSTQNLVKDLEKDTSKFPLKTKLQTVNKAILDRNAEKLLSFFDRDYLLNYFVAKSLLGFSGHECYQGNWYLFFNSQDSLFYPSINREPNFMKLREKGSLKEKLSFYNHPFVDRSNLELIFYHVVLSDETFYNDLKQKLNQVILNNEDEITANWESSIKNYNNLLTSNLPYDLLYPEKCLEDISENIEILKNLGE